VLGTKKNSKEHDKEEESNERKRGESFHKRRGTRITNGTEEEKNCTRKRSQKNSDK
jgi:hypothetical protein